MLPYYKSNLKSNLSQITFKQAVRQPNAVDAVVVFAIFSYHRTFFNPIFCSVSMSASDANLVSLN